MRRFVLCAVVAWMVLGVLGAPTSARPDDAEDKAAALVERLGGKFSRDEKAPGKPVVKVDLHYTLVSGADLRALAALKGLTHLDLSLNKGLGDAHLKELPALTNLTELNLEATSITDVGLKELAPLAKLASLDLTYTNVTPAALKTLAAFPNLTKLRLNYNSLTDADVLHLAALKGLTHLALEPVMNLCG
jgi:internalin A